MEQYARARRKQNGGRIAKSVGKNTLSYRECALHLYKCEFAALSSDWQAGGGLFIDKRCSNIQIYKMILCTINVNRMYVYNLPLIKRFFLEIYIG